MLQVAELLDVDISPDIFEPWPFEYQGLLGQVNKWYEILGWGLLPANDEMLRFLMERGTSDARSWAKAKGLLPEEPLIPTQPMAPAEPTLAYHRGAGRR